ncbi:MAG: hypothetical protein HOO19_11120 [Rhodospirillaceae bacterium]|jgi:hypothetical protein|nr:hypothetical protein [Rhodospirillaceae bacterium]MBT3883563.1 hypothetical protein [Rhodospirillaceae bacterium]MBT4117540.1 hypothetical protein [Rhodospirillaceae bacterium]MBT4670629.1 hypothetical protein [Rhodospirillaceae bacterium]MBT4749874.1 hypothetical protein [Rhodospirillaceae bacterium]
MKRKRTTLHPSEWPELDQKLWQAANSLGGFLEPDGRAVHWRDKTRKGVVKRYGLWLGYLNETGQIGECTSPAGRISEEALAGYVDWLEDRGNASTTMASAVRDLVEALRVMEPGADIHLLKELNITLHARQEPTREKHTRIMHPDENGDDQSDPRIPDRTGDNGSHRRRCLAQFTFCNSAKPFRRDITAHERSYCRPLRRLA